MDSFPENGFRELSYDAVFCSDESVPFCRNFATVYAYGCKFLQKRNILPGVEYSTLIKAK